MAQVGCGSVGFTRTGSCASAGAPINRHKNVGKLQKTDFMTTSL